MSDFPNCQSVVQSSNVGPTKMTRAPDPGSQDSRPSSRPRPIRPAATPIPRPPAPAAPCCIPRSADMPPSRSAQNPPSRSRSISWSRSRGRRPVASSIRRWGSLSFFMVSSRSSKRPTRSPGRRIDSRNRTMVRAIASSVRNGH
jgi:hypothetical protein